MAKNGAVDKIGTWVPISGITLIPELQIRIEVDQEHVSQLTQAFRDEIEVDPIDLVIDAEGQKVLADGTHRYLGCAGAGLEKIRAIIHECDPKKALSTALEISLRNNCHHGLKLTAAGKRKAVGMAVRDDVIRKQSDRAIARLCGVSPNLVAEVRKDPDKKPAPKKKKVAEKTVEVSAHTRSGSQTEAKAPEPGVKSMLQTRVDTVTEWIKQGSLDWPTVAEIFTSKTHTPTLFPKSISTMWLMINGSKKTIPIKNCKIQKVGLEYFLEVEAADAKMAAETANA